MNGLNCHECNTQIKKVRGCEGFIEPKEFDEASGIRGIKIARCPLKEVTRQSFLYLEAYHQYKNGHFPTNDGWLKQPMKLLQALKYIQHEVERLGEHKKWLTRN